MATTARTLPWYRTVGSLEDQAAALDFESLLQSCRNIYMRIPADGRSGGRRTLHGVLRAVVDTWDRPPTDTVTPEDTLRAAGISNKRQAKYQRRMSSLLAGWE